MSGDKLGSSNEPPSKTPGSTTPGKDEKVASSTNTKAADGIFKLEETFPNLQDLLQPHVLPPLKSQDVIVALDTNALLLPFELKPGNLASLESVYERLRKEDRLIVPGRALREFVNLRDKKLANLVQALNNRKGNQQYELTLKLITVEQATKAASAAKTIQQAKHEYDEVITTIVDNIRSWRGNDPVTEMYNRIFCEVSLVDLPYEKGNIESYLAEFRRRVAAKVPPGYKDKGKDDEGIGDFLIWKTLLNVGKDRQFHLAFVTGEEKSDWFVRSEQATIFPRIELVDEYRRASGGKLIRLLSLHELLRELDLEPDFVNEVERAEASANSEVRTSASTVLSLAPSPPIVYSSIFDLSMYPHFFRLPGPGGEALFTIKPKELNAAEISTVGSNVIYLCGNLRSRTLIDSFANLPFCRETVVNHDEAVIVGTGDGVNIAIRFNFDPTGSNVLRTDWSIFPKGSSIVLP
jgi:hypothetical protein